MSQSEAVVLQDSALVCALGRAFFEGEASALDSVLRGAIERSARLEGCRGVVFAIAGSETDPTSGPAPHPTPSEPFYAMLSWLLQQAPKPLVAALSGQISGAAAGLALCLDAVVMSHDAVLRHPHREQGAAVLGGSTKRLTLQIGPARAKEFILLGQPTPAALAYDWGIAQRLVEPGALLASAASLVSDLSEDPQDVLRRRSLLIASGPAATMGRA